MAEPVTAWAKRAPWLNSIHVHMLGLSMGVIAALTGISLALLYIFSPPTRAPVSVYELTRIVHGLPVVRSTGQIERRLERTPPPPPDNLAEQVVSTLIAKRLGLPADAVRISLQQDEERANLIAREARLYGAAANPLVVGSFTLGIRQDGHWRTYKRESTAWFYIWQITGWNVLLIGSILVLPLSLWFSARLARPIEAFAASAQRLGGGRAVEPVEIAGPTEIRLAAQSLNDMQARILRFVGERTTLLGAIAHDLRAPLSRLHFHLNGAPAELRSAAEEEIREMERLVDVTLQFVENETRSQQREPLDLSMLVEGVADDFADVGKDVEVKDADPITTTGDPMLLKRLFVNVVDNALKYGGRAEIRVRREGDRALVEVRDHGPGMSEEELARAFEPFFRGEPSRNRKTGGVGLGLAIVKSATDAHGGTVDLRNAPDGGLLVTVRLPIRTPAATRKGQQAAS